MGIWGQGRTPDKPGVWRILDRGKGLTLSGVNAQGRRVKVPVNSRDEAEKLAVSLFPPLEGTKPAISAWEETDDFGLPVSIKPSADAVSSANAKLGIPAPGEPVPPTTTALAVRDENKARKAKQADSLMEMIALGAGAGVVMGGVKLCEIRDKVPVKPNPKQVNDFTDSTAETLRGWFGDRDIKPWQMMILLGLGIPLTMLIQAKPKEKPAAELPKSSAAK